jgi:aminoglycoside N3'-acetyltransferase
MLTSLKRKWFPKGFRRSLHELRNLSFRRVSRKDLIHDLRRLGLCEGDLVCVHSSLSGLGHLLGGPATAIEALRAVIGDRGTLMMPTFTGGASTLRYVQSQPPPFDPGATPSTTGAITELFRKIPGTFRSFHPTHSVAAQGPLAQELLRDHEKSVTPFGSNTPYDRFLDLDGKILLLNTNGNSILHRVQEIVDWPNHYLEEQFSLPVLMGGRPVAVTTSVHSPSPCHHVLLPGREEQEERLIHIPSYALPFLLGESDESEYRRLRADVAKDLEDRLQYFTERGVVKMGPVGFGKAAVIKSGGFCRRIVADLVLHLSEQRAAYRVSNLRRIVTRRTMKSSPS